MYPPDQASVQCNDHYTMMYDYHYQSREYLYQLTTRDNRAPASNLYRYLRDVIPSEDVIPNLRACGLVKFNKKVLIDGLKKLKSGGYKPLFDGIEKRFMISLCKKIGIYRFMQRFLWINLICSDCGQRNKDKSDGMVHNSKFEVKSWVNMTSITNKKIINE